MWAVSVESKGDFDGRSLGNRFLGTAREVRDGLPSRGIQSAPIVRGDSSSLQHGIREHPVDVVPAKVGVTGGGDHLDQRLFTIIGGEHAQKRDIKRSTTKIEDHHGLSTFSTFTKSIRKRCGSWLVHDASHVESSQTCCITRRVPLRVVEISRDGDDRTTHGGTQSGLGDLAQSHEDMCADFLGRDTTCTDRDGSQSTRAFNDLEWKFSCVFIELTRTSSKQSLGTPHGRLRIQDGLIQRLAPHNDILVLKSNDGRKEPSTIGIFEDPRSAIIAVGDERIRGSKINPDDRIVRCEVLAGLG